MSQLKLKTKWIALVVILMTVSACGNLSNEDLIFLAAIPKASEVALVVESNQEGLENALKSADGGLGSEAVYYVLSKGMAGEINGGVLDILTVVDNLGRGYPPTNRTENARIWGPVENFEGTGSALRLEISRADTGGEFLTYSFCLQMSAPGEYTGETASCDTPGTSGLLNILFGNYTPSEAAGTARSGTGIIGLDLESASRVGPQEHELGLYEIDYDFSQGGESKQVEVHWRPTDVEASNHGNVDYSYSRTLDNHVDFFFEFSEDIIPSSANQKERASIAASWDEGGKGSADVAYGEGDLGPNEKVLALECWNSQHERTYFKLLLEGQADSLEEEGDAESCPAQEN